ncbi:hypothetical protein BGZ80_011199 [Entomortierella chlamydospora]|uniref:Uncharacterized protein n=1 Tax=Entomortierella chlamydospora TaxID=101097 RepID=A0A9P6SZ68_9FUNG|nr:hypothetical protein BGZ79_008457 [Entomortierella chlamydospora]KAG0013252.1 hypothetical protein BGZ80_011199 [Entomortierella chlamydospora]
MRFILSVLLASALLGAMATADKERRDVSTAVIAPEVPNLDLHTKESRSHHDKKAASKHLELHRKKASHSHNKKHAKRDLEGIRLHRKKAQHQQGSWTEEEKRHLSKTQDIKRSLGKQRRASQNGKKVQNKRN